MSAFEFSKGALISPMPFGFLEGRERSAAISELRPRISDITNHAVFPPI